MSQYDEICGYEEHCQFSYSTDAEWDAAEARELGEANRDVAWILSNRDVWHPNPYYKGPKVPHPEEEQYEDDGGVYRPTLDGGACSDLPPDGDIPF